MELKKFHENHADQIKSMKIETLVELKVDDANLIDVKSPEFSNQSTLNRFIKEEEKVSTNIIMDN